MSIADKALWTIERNSGDALTLARIAAACGVSRSHLANAFGTATGMPVMKYVRGRRLTAAALALAGGAQDILAVALDAGYGSHEAFTRAFREQFDVTPESVRARGDAARLALVAPLALRARSAQRLDPPRLVEQDALRIVGAREQHAFGETARIPGQWQRFMSHYAAIPGKRDPIPVGVSQATDDGFWYLCGVEVDAFRSYADGLQTLELAPARYAVFEHRGHVSAIDDTYAEIWNDALDGLGYRAADAPVVEHHNPEFDPRTGEGGLTLWIPLAAAEDGA
jgi:AraC family transcriptional regulator